MLFRFGFMAAPKDPSQTKNSRYTRPRGKVQMDGDVLACEAPVIKVRIALVKPQKTKKLSPMTLKLKICQRLYPSLPAIRTVREEIGRDASPTARIARGTSWYPTLQVSEQSRTILPSPNANPIKKAGRDAKSNLKFKEPGSLDSSV